jgi:hypothetical protein
MWCYLGRRWMRYADVYIHELDGDESMAGLAVLEID